MTISRKTLDVHLLRVMQVLLQECNVSRAARRLNLSQPAVSSALRRLRELTGDALLVRGRNGMTPTERGREMSGAVRIALEQIERITGQRYRSEVAATQRHFKLATPDYLPSELLGRLCGALRRQAPLSRLICHALERHEDYAVALETGEIDLVVADWPQPPPALRRMPLFQDRLVCLMRRGHPLESRLDGVDYLAAEHLAPTPHPASPRGTLDLFLARERLYRRIIVQIPYPALVPEILRQTDLIFTCPRRFAACHDTELSVVDLPFDCPDVDYYLLWHERSHADAECRWLREQLQEGVDTLESDAEQDSRGGAAPGPAIGGERR